jgi:hypothetical protein
VNFSISALERSHDVCADEDGKEHEADVEKKGVYCLTLWGLSLHGRMGEADKAGDHQCSQYIGRAPQHHVK